MFILWLKYSRIKKDQKKALSNFVVANNHLQQQQTTTTNNNNNNNKQQQQQTTTTNCYNTPATAPTPSLAAADADAI